MKIKTLKLEGNRFITENDQDDTIGEIKEDGTVVKEYFGQGLIYKNFKNFEQKSGPCYIAEYQGEKDTDFHNNIVSDELKTKNFNDMVEGEDYETYDTIIKQVKDEYARRNQKVSEQTIEDTAKEIFYEVDWQYVSSLLDEWLDAEEEAYEEEQEELNEKINIPSKEDELDGCVKSEYAVNIHNKDRKTSFNKPEFDRQYDVYETYEDAVKTVKTKEFKDDLKDYETFDIVKIYYDEYGNELGVDTVDDEETLREDNHKLENYKKVDMAYTPLTETKSVTNRARKLKESLSQNEEDAIYSAGDFGELLDTLDNMKQDAKVQRARNLTSHAYTHIPDEEEDERLDEIKDEVISILTESLRDGWKPDVDLYTKLMKEMQDNLGISEYEIQKEADAIKFRYNGEVYFAEPRSTCQVDIFDDNHKQIGWGVVTDKIKQEVFTDYVTNQDFLYQLVGGEYAGTYTREEAEKLPIREPELTDDLDDVRARGGFVHRKELDNQFQFKGYVGPMWNGTKDGKGVIRYETPEVNDMLSR